MDPRHNLGITHGYPYDPRTHTFLSPAGMAYPGPNPYRPPSPLLAGPLTGPGTFQSGAQNFLLPGAMNGHGDWNGGMDPNARGIHASTGQGHPQYPTLGHGLAHPSLPHRPVAVPPHGSPLAMSSQASQSSIMETQTRQTPTHLSSAFPHSTPQRSPSAPLDPRRDKRKALPDPLGVSQRDNDGRRIVSDLPGRARKMGGPPKAILGGVGGKTFEEMQLEKAATPSQPSSSGVEPVKPLAPSNEPPSNMTPITTSKWKGANVAIKLPPSHYSPPDSPPADKPIPEHPPPLEGDTPKKSGKDAYPWPKHRKVLSGGSNSGANRKHAGNVGTVRRSKAPIVSGEYAETSWRGKEVLVGLPSQDAWGSLIARAEEVKKRKEMAEIARHDDNARSEQDVHDGALTSRSKEDEPDSTPEVFSKGRPGNSAFLKRSLGGILRDGTVKDSAGRFQHRPISDVFSMEDPNETSEDMTSSDATGQHDEDDTAVDTARVREGAPSPEFEEIPLSGVNASTSATPVGGSGPMDAETTPRRVTELEVEAPASVLKSPLSELGDLRTITPAKSRRFGPLVQQGFEGEQVDIDETEGATPPQVVPTQKSSSVESAEDKAKTAGTASFPTKPLRGEAEAFRPMSSRTMSTSSISSSVLGLTTLPTKLRPGAAAFVPGHRSVSSMSVTSDTDSTHSASKMALRASAAAFKPRGSAEASRTSSVHGETGPSAISTPSPQKRVVGLRADASVWQPTSRTASMSSTVSRPFTDTEGDRSFDTSETGAVSPIKHSALTSPTRLHATAQPFVPFQTAFRSVSSPAPGSSGNGDQMVDPSDREERKDTGKRAKLRPSAVAFVPSRSISATITRRQGLAAQALAGKEDDGKRLVPDTFEFAPTLRPTAPAFAPRFGARDDAMESGGVARENQHEEPAQSTPRRARAETVAFGAVPLETTPHATEDSEADLERTLNSPASVLHKLHGTAINAQPQDDEASSVGEVRESVDLSGLFYRPREDTVSTQYAEEGPTVWRGEASPRDPVDGNWQDAVDDRVDETESRPNRMERSNSTRSIENSHLPVAIASRARSAADFAVSEVAIHPSHPFNTPLISARNTDIVPDVPRSAHTGFASGSGGVPSPAEPVPPLPVFARAQNTPPASTLAGLFVKPPLSALPGGISDTFAPSPPAAARPVGGQVGESPASRYSQSSARTPIKFTQSPPIKLSQTPRQRRRTSAASTAGNETFTTADGSPLIPSRSIVKPMATVPSSNPLSSVPDPQAELPEPITKADVFVARETPAIKVDGADQRFREWIFPLHDPRPSISRRHTIPTGLSPEILGPGIASTSFTERVGDLRAATSGARALSSLSDPGHLDTGDLLEEPTQGREREASVEFPLRPGNRLLKVVNDASRPLTMAAEPTNSEAVDQVETIRGLVERLEERLDRAQNHATGVRGVEDASAKDPGLEHQLRECLQALQLQTSLINDMHQQQRQLARGSPVDRTQHDPRAQEMFQAMLTGQHAMLDKLAELSEGKVETWQAIDSIRLANLQMYDQLAQNTTLQDQVAALEALRSTIGQLTESSAEARSDAGIFKSRLDDARKERDGLREELGHKSKRLQSLEIKVKDQEAENDKQLAMRLAAELERDTLSKNLLNVRDEFDKLAGELDLVQAESARVKADTDALRADIQARDAAQESVRQSEIAQLRNVTAILQESLLARLSGLEEGMGKEASVERLHLVDENARLQEEIRSLRQRLDASTETNASFQASLAERSAKAESEHASLRKQLSTEQERRQASDERIEGLERQVEQVRREMIDARTIATERQAYARMSEVQLQTLTQEAVYWRQFALEADRRKYRTYMASKPFHSSPPDAQLQTPDLGGPGTRELEQGASEPKTPTQNGGKPAHPLSHSVVARLPDEEEGEGQWWGLAA